MAKRMREQVELTRGQKAARTRARRKRAAARREAQAAQQQPTFDAAAIMEHLTGLTKVVDAIGQRVFGQGTGAQTAITQHVETPAERKAREEQERKAKLIADLKAQLSVLEGGDNGAVAANGDDSESLTPGTYTPQTDFGLPLLRTLAEMPGGGGAVRDVLSRMERRIQLKPNDYGKLSNGAIRWENAVMFQRQKAKDKGYLDGSQRGFWYVTPAGKVAAKLGKW